MDWFVRVIVIFAITRLLLNSSVSRPWRAVPRFTGQFPALVRIQRGVLRPKLDHPFPAAVTGNSRPLAALSSVSNLQGFGRRSSAWAGG
jgi:hypothetical protein